MKNAKYSSRLRRGTTGWLVGALTLSVLLGAGSSLAIAPGAAADVETPQPVPSTQPLENREIQSPEATPSTAPTEEETTTTGAPTQPSVEPQAPTAGESTGEETSPDTTPDPAASDAPATSEKQDATADEEAGGISTLSRGDDGALVWTVKQGGQFVGGASIRLQGPATYSFFGGGLNWGSVVDVPDCVSGPCTGLDQDPLPGRFLVTTVGDGSAVISGKRYRVQELNAPSGYSFVNTPPVWREIAQRNFFDPGNGPDWQRDTWDFLNFELRDPLQFAPKCETGYVYGLNSNGQMRQATPGTNVTPTNLGNPIPGVSAFNGLGIGPGGKTAFAYERTTQGSLGNNVATIYSYSAATGNWSNTGTSVVSSGDRLQTFLAGAVDLDTGIYFFGGYSYSGDKFQIWGYTPGSNTTTYKGFIDTSRGMALNSNGDMAFDQFGNLFVVRGLGTTTTVYSVTAENFKAANGSGRIRSAISSEFQTIDNVNGVAFDARGKAYLGSGPDLRSFDMPGWTNQRSVVAGGFNSYDLASCSSPPTVTLEKDVRGRVNTADQFKLELKQGTKLLGDATTVGSSTGIQEERVGPLPVVTGTQLTFSESFLGGANADNYASSWQCNADGVPLSSGSGASGNVTIPTTATTVVCRIVNTPLVASVKIRKTLVDGNGNETPGANWRVGATPVATTGTATLSPTGLQNTNAAGDASWNVRFNTQSARATVTVSEQMQDGYVFVAGVCSIQPLAGAPTQQIITNHLGQSLTGIKPGDSVSCEFKNALQPAATVVVNKRWSINGAAPVPPGDPSLPAGLSAQPGLTPAGTPAGNLDWGSVRGGFRVAQRVTISETASVDSALLPGCRLEPALISGDGITGNQALGTVGLTVELPLTVNSYTVTNSVVCEQTLTLVKNVVNDFDGQPIPTEWRLEAADWDGGLTARKADDASLTFDSGQRLAVAAGEYVVSEVSKDNYVFDNLQCEGGTLTTGTSSVTVGLGQEVVCTFTNRDAPGSVTWTKVNENGDLLEGSEWKLESSGEFVAVDDCVAGDATGCAGLDKDPEAGKFSVEGLAWGGYSLVETRAPAGYLISTESYDFTISRDARDKVFENGIINVQREGLVIPMTGGLGAQQFAIIAVLMVSLAAGGVLWQRRRHG